MKIYIYLFVLNLLFANNYHIEAQQFDTLFDIRDSKIYKITKIGSRVWMAENLNYEVKNSWTYQNLPENGKKYGRLYSWDAANQVCPSGWQLPSDNDWKDLERFLAMPEAEIEKSDDWRGTNQTTRLVSDTTLGFNLLFGGYRNLPSNFYLLDSQAFFWTSTLLYDSAWLRQLFIQNPKIYRRTRPKSWAFSVRCIKNQ